MKAFETDHCFVFPSQNLSLIDKMESTNKAPIEANLDPASYEPEDIITKGVCMVGGGCSGTLTVILLQDSDKSVVAIKKRSKLGGHTSTYTSTYTDTALYIGVLVFGRLEEVRKHFARFNISFKVVPTSLGAPRCVDFSTGETVALNIPD